MTCEVPRPWPEPGEWWPPESAPRDGTPFLARYRVFEDLERPEIHALVVHYETAGKGWSFRSGPHGGWRRDSAMVGWTALTEGQSDELFDIDGFIRKLKESEDDLGKSDI